MDLINTKLTFHHQLENPFKLPGYKEGWTCEALWTEEALELVDTELEGHGNELYLNKTVLPGQVLFTLFSLPTGAFREIFQYTFIGDSDDEELEGWEEMIIPEVKKHYQVKPWLDIYLVS
ncbi:MAG TPA: hypothetical protein DCS93_16880 [Microscillaceae bacterium]|nr:hypothetical protein [Microscillaceae bacterium]